jgi:hypothetical protein
MLDHYVVFKPRPGREQELSLALGEFAAAITGLACLSELTWGENVNKSGLALGFTHGCHASLTDLAALQGEYWNHPAHQRLLSQLDNLCEDRFGMDYLVGEKG